MVGLLFYIDRDPIKLLLTNLRKEVRFRAVHDGDLALPHSQ